jgi:hypothetical protein
MAKKSKVRFTQDVLDRSETSVELIGGYIGAGADGTGCQTYGRMQLNGVRIISDEGLAEIIAAAEARGAEQGEASAIARLTKNAKAFEKNAAKIIAEAEQHGYDRCLERMRETLGKVKTLTPNRVTRIMNQTSSPGVSRFAAKE